MNVSVEEAGPCRKKLRVEIAADKVNEEYDAIVKAYTKSARIPGFRPGRAPRNLVRKHYGKDITEEVRDRLIPQGYREALKEQGISPVAVLGIDEVQFKEGEPLTFSVTLDVPPDFKLPEYRGISLKGQPVEVAAADVDRTVEQIRESRARYEDVSGRPVQKDDLVQVDYEGVCDGQPIEELAPEAKGLGQAVDFWVHAGANAFLPEFAEGLLGLSEGERKQVFVAFKEDFRVEALVGKKAMYFVTVKAIREKKLPELDHDFLKGIGVESEAALRKSIEDDLVKMGEEREKSRLKAEIVKHLLDKTKMELPGSVVEEETRNTIYDIVRENTARGISQEQIEENRSEIFDAAGKNAADKVKARYILNRIAATEHVEVGEVEVEERIESLAKSYGMPAQDMRTQLERKNMIEGLMDQIRMDKTMDFLLEEASIKK